MGTKHDDFWSHVDVTEECWLWTGTLKGNGYGYWRENDGRYAHRKSWINTFGPIPEGMCVLHRCDTPLCVRPDHLFLGTHGDNMRDMVAKGRGRYFRGDQHPRMKIKDANVQAIQDEAQRRGVKLKRGVRDGKVNAFCGEFGAKYGIAPSMVKKILGGHKRRNAWVKS